ncbi:aldehyde dehydrogenase family protein [Ralstonia nicotianae]|uniref:L-piperidine-6-carboxylate dehydrogenase n=1 Tax=Ralstonia pseudosolanacearum TaxID=1310165 RepID=UPI0002C06699|nr:MULTISPECIES: aldehyde dehydrogenase family protein [Ralstonia]ANH35253.1 putative Aldehyde dehydrogenase family 7 member A1, similar to eukaryote aldehyde dehydrogenase [Ralstonia solanacearum]AGH87560.1 Aldehyde dehydrogenase B [Ralstonia pseudosolanacearum FQY_4]MDO3516333.1 aldehyde dehydrogenase family protein [Ralstonia pseudosolanacearum]MDO3540771.1 aldehyde dehydrogenase family protein [Ralstonia pseudosolanacearum]OAI59561.1 aldehyde dehydrogenase [Ralstonia pseudosolanacearum]
MRVSELLSSLSIDGAASAEGGHQVRSPIDGTLIGSVKLVSAKESEAAIERGHAAFLHWRGVPAPVRGELVRLLGVELRRHKEALGRLVTLEAGKLLSEGLGEVQEMIDICDFAVGLSRQLYGLTLASERPGHRMMETWHPVGVVGVISAFNFPAAVWAWNSALAFVCGDSVVWKPSEKTPLTALACDALFRKAVAAFSKAHPGTAPDGLHALLVGGREAGEALVQSKRVPVVSATGSTRMGRLVSARVGERLGRAILELGGNNAMIVAPSADLELATRAITFAAVGTAGQRCTTLRRLIVHESVAANLVERLKRIYGSVTVGNPLQEGTLVGPLIDAGAYAAMAHALERAGAQGGRVHGGERTHLEAGPEAYYVKPALVEMPAQTEVMQQETFAPILYVLTYRTLDEAIALQNGVPQGLSSAIFTRDLNEAEWFLSAAGSDCGIANVNIGTSGAEIGGAFGGEKETGGGRESGSDAWKAYMRRATNTINYSNRLPLAQGVRFDV